jgi:hypothetical protein
MAKVSQKKMEFWNSELLEDQGSQAHYSIIPLFHYSINKAKKSLSTY